MSRINVSLFLLVCVGAAWIQTAESTFGQIFRDIHYFKCDIFCKNIKPYQLIRLNLCRRCCPHLFETTTPMIQTPPMTAVPTRPWRITTPPTVEITTKPPSITAPPTSPPVKTIQTALPTKPPASTVPSVTPIDSKTSAPNAPTSATVAATNPADATPTVQTPISDGQTTK